MNTRLTAAILDIFISLQAAIFLPRSTAPAAAAGRSVIRPTYSPRVASAATRQLAPSSRAGGVPRERREPRRHGGDGLICATVQAVPRRDPDGIIVGQMN